MTDVILPKRRATLNVGLEMIDFQKDNFGKELEAYFQQVKDDIDSGKIKYKKDIIGRSPEALQLEKMVFKRFGFRIKVVFDTTIAGAVIPFYANNQHILADEFMREFIHDIRDFNKIRKHIENKTGTIDLKNAKVDGIFSVFEHEFYMDIWNMLKDGKITPAHLAAISLHEFGHVFTYYEYSDRTSRTNQVMLNVVEHLQSGKNEKSSTYLYAELKKVYDITKEEADALASDNRLVAGVKMIAIYIDAVRSAMPVDKYNDTSSEQLADMFASRFGYGRQLIEGLDILHREFGAPEFSTATRIVLMMLEILEMCFYVGFIIITTFVSTTVLPVALFAGFLIGVCVLKVSGSADKDMTYDDLRERYLRVRQQMIAQLKLVENNPNVLKQQIANIERMDTLIAGVKPYNGPFKHLSDFVFASNRKIKKDIAMQQLVEALAHNDLFLMSANFKVLSSQGA